MDSFILTARIRAFGFICSNEGKLYKAVDDDVSPFGADLAMRDFYTFKSSHTYLSLVFDEVPLLLHVVRDKYLRHLDLASSLLFFFHLSLSATVHPLLGTDVQSLALVLIVSLPLLKKSLLADSI